MITAVAFDFSRRTERAIAPEEVQTACAEGCYCWIDIEAEDHERVRELLGERLRLSARAVANVIGADEDGRCDLHEDCIHVGLTEARPENGSLATAHVDVVLARSCLVTFRRKPVAFLTRMRETYRADFLAFSRSPGFLLYEIGDGLLSVYRRSLRQFETEAERIQEDLLERGNEAVFERVSSLNRQLLTFRKEALAARDILNQLAARKSVFVSETTQPFLESIAGSIDRLCNDLAAERDVLNDVLALYMGIVSHRTNRIVTRLTVLSAVFLPLTFICGVYGMNIPIPETQWPHAYAAFWALVALVVVGMLALIRRWK